MELNTTLSCFDCYCEEAVHNIFLCVFIVDPDTPVINIYNFNETSVEVNYSTGSTTTTDSKTLFYSCGISVNNSQPVTSSQSYVVSGLQPGCNYTLYLVVQRYDKTKTSNYVTVITSKWLSHIEIDC